MALVLTRKAGQGIWIGNDIYVSIQSISSHEVKVSIDAPKSINIFREELLWREWHENAG